MPQNNPLAPLIVDGAGLARPLVRLTLRGRIYGQTTMNVFYYVRRDQLPTPGDPVPTVERDDLVATFASGVVAPWAAVLASDIAFDDVLFRQQNIATAANLPIALPAGPVVGAIAPPAETQTVAVVASRYTDLAGKHGRGRLYWAGVPHSVVDSGRISAGAIGGFNGAAQTLDDPLSPAGVGGVHFPWDPYVVATKLRPGELIWRGALITRAVVRDVLRQQRRREIGVGI